MPDDHDHPVSLSGSRLLSRIDGANPEIVARLAELDVHDVDQLRALVAVEDMKPHLLAHVEIGGEALDVFVAQIEDGLTPEEQVPPPVLARGPLALGALPPTDRTRADTGPFFVWQAVPSLPSQVNLIPDMLAITNQGGRGTCVGFGGVAMTEQYWGVHGSKTKLSEEFLYDETKKIDGHPGDCGTWLVYATRVIASLGVCPLSVESYNPNPPCNTTQAEPAAARPAAARYRTTPHMINPRDVTAMKTALAQGKAVAFCIPVYNSWYQSSATRRTGAVTMRVGSEASVGGHCLCMVGYQDNPSSPGGGYFIIRNSWTTAWGYACAYGAGYGTIPYQYLTNDGNEAAFIA